MIEWEREKGITQAMKVKGRGEGDNRNERRKRLGPTRVMTFKRREKELWEAKLKGGRCGTCRNLHDEGQPCHSDYLTWQRVIQITNKHKQLVQTIPSGTIYNKEKHMQTADEKEKEDEGEGEET